MASTVCAVPEGYPAEIIGYADPWIVSPGDSVDIKVNKENTLPEAAPLFLSVQSY
jgi:hypothetical protein